jgi:uncharacterized membrane protein
MDFINRVITAVTETHPLHPMIVHFPIALSGAAALFILLALWKKDAGFEKIAFANISLTALSSVFAGASGMYDNQLNYLGDAPNASLKMILAIALFLISTVLTITRWRNPEVFNGRAKALYVAGYLVSFGLALVLAFLGGVILYGF